MIDYLENLISCHDWETPFVDAFSQFSLGFDQNNVGPSWLHPRGTIATYEIAMPLLQLWLMEDGFPQIVKRRQLRSWPWRQSEEALLYRKGKPIAVEADYVFVDARRLLMQWRFEHQGSETVALDPVWVGCLRDRQQPVDVLQPYEGARTAPRELTLLAQGQGIEAGLEPDPTASDLPHVRYRLTSLDRRVIGVKNEGPIWGGSPVHDRAHFYSFRAENPFLLEPGKSQAVGFVLDFRAANVGEPLDEWKTSNELDFGDAMESAKKRYRSAVQLDDFESEPDTAKVHRLRARTSILRTGLRGFNGEFGDHTATLCSSGTQDFSSSFFWDSFFTATALARFNPEFARGALMTAFTRQHPRDGSTPERKWNYSCPQYSTIGCPQSAIGAWALQHYLRHNRATEDFAFAQALYPKLKRNHLFWRDYSDADADGLAEYNWSGQIGDDSQLWDTVATGKDPVSGCCWLPPIASATCNSFLYRDACELQEIAQTLGLGEEVVFWEERAAFIAERMQELLWVKADARYWDYNHRSRTHNRIETFFMFLPLWAKLPMPDEAKQDLIENYLLAENKFFGAIPFPSVSYDHPAYDPGGYWRGRAWSHFSCWLVELLWREGYQQEADAAANRIIAWQSMWNFRENMHTDPSELFPRGFPYYNWGSAAFCFLAERAYREA